MNPSSWTAVVIPVVLVAVALVVGAVVGIVFLIRGGKSGGERAG